MMLLVNISARLAKIKPVVICHVGRIEILFTEITVNLGIRNPHYLILRLKNCAVQHCRTTKKAPEGAFRVILDGTVIAPNCLVQSAPRTPQFPMGNGATDCGTTPRGGGRFRYAPVLRSRKRYAPNRVTDCCPPPCSPLPSGRC